VAKRYVIRYQQATMFTLFTKSIKYHTFCIEDVLSYNKTETGISIIIENFSLSVHNMLPLIFDLGQHITNFGSQ